MYHPVPSVMPPSLLRATKGLDGNAQAAFIKIIEAIRRLGHLGVQYAKAMGLHVCAVDIDDNKLEHAKQLGADAVVNAKTDDPVAAVVKITNGSVHGVLITAPSLPDFKQGVGMTGFDLLSWVFSSVMTNRYDRIKTNTQNIPKESCVGKSRISDRGSAANTPAGIANNKRAAARAPFTVR
jgi:Zn-dependent alcohol dehydrogenase